VTWVDLVPILLVIVYVGLGYFTGVVRRIIALIGLYVACIAATGMGIQAGSLISQAVGLETPDGRIYGFFGLLIIIVAGIDAAAQLIHQQIQIEAIVLNRVTGVAVGLLTAILLSVIVVYELQAAAAPSGGAVPAHFQAQVRDTVAGSHFAVPFVNAISKPIIALFQPALPGDPHQYFSRGPVT
jgi:uncharacterized membrane protein required for colicin V production